MDDKYLNMGLKIGKTEGNYKYLVGVINEYDKISIGSPSRLEGRRILRKGSIYFLYFRLMIYSKF